MSPLFWRFYVQHRWVPTQGTVVKNTVYSNKGQRRAAGYHYPSVEFTADGQTHVFESRWRKRATKSPRFSVGDSVEILYHPRRPTRAIIRTWGRYLRWVAVAELCFLAIFLAPILLTLLTGNK